MSAEGFTSGSAHHVENAATCESIMTWGNMNKLAGSKKKVVICMQEWRDVH